MDARHLLKMTRLVRGRDAGCWPTCVHHGRSMLREFWKLLVRGNNAPLAGRKPCHAARRRETLSSKQQAEYGVLAGWIGECVSCVRLVVLKFFSLSNILKSILYEMSIHCTTANANTHHNTYTYTLLSVEIYVCSDLKAYVGRSWRKTKSILVNVSSRGQEKFRCCSAVGHLFASIFAPPCFKPRCFNSHASLQPASNFYRFSVRASIFTQTQTRKRTQL